MAQETKLSKKIETYEDEETGKDVEYVQLYLTIKNVRVKIRPTYKNDKKLLVALAEDEDDD